MSGRDKIAEMQKIFQSSSQYTHLQVRTLRGGVRPLWHHK